MVSVVEFSGGGAGGSGWVVGKVGVEERCGWCGGKGGVVVTNIAHLWTPLPTTGSIGRSSSDAASAKSPHAGGRLGDESWAKSPHPSMTIGGRTILRPNIEQPWRRIIRPVSANGVGV